MEQTERRKVIWSAAVTGAILFALCVLQTTVLGRWKLFGAVPDVMLCATVLLGYCRGREAGAIGGIAAGVMLAALGSVGATVAPIFYMVVGYVCGYFARAVNPKGLLSYLVFLGASLPFGAVRTVVQAVLTHGAGHPGQLLLYAVLPEAAGTVIMGILLFFPLRASIGCAKKR